MDDFEVRPEIEKTQETIRCINCVYYEKGLSELVTYANCRKKAEISRFDDYCESWSRIDWESLFDGKEKPVSEELVMRDIINELKSQKNIKVSGTGTIRIKHETDSNFPTLKVQYKSQTDSYSVFVQAPSDRAFLSLRNKADAEMFVEWYKCTLELKASRKG